MSRVEVKFLVRVVFEVNVIHVTYPHVFLLSSFHNHFSSSSNHLLALPFWLRLLNRVFNSV